MIKYSLICEQGHEFEGWFSSSDDYDAQNKRGFVTCAICGNAKISKTLMAPKVSGTKKSSDGADASVPMAQMPPPQLPAEMVEQIRKIKKHVEANSENVGDKFSEEARKIHYGEAEERGIYGKASLKEASELVEEGVNLLPIPQLPEDGN